MPITLSTAPALFRKLSIILFITWLISELITPAEAALLGHKWEATSFCKCICFGSNYTILHLNLPDNPSKPCQSCTRQWCLNQNLPKCQGATLGDTNMDTGTGKEGDIEARCFQRDSPRDQLIVTLFLLTVFGLLLGAGIKGKMVKAGFDTRLPWNAGRNWWEVWLPRSQLGDIGLGSRRDQTGSDAQRRGDYVNVNNEEIHEFTSRS